MLQKNTNKLSTEPYKGVRDFYPEDMAVQNHIYNGMRTTVEKYGYEEYSASILEPSELYYAKTGEEIVNDQTYTFTDRGGRAVTLRPEMTPTVARLVAAKKRELAFPLRWYSIPNIFRYERPQRGRLREHWQLNVDLFGVDTIEADAEIVTISHDILRNYGLSREHYSIHISYSGMLKETLQTKFELSEMESVRVVKLLDKLVKGNESRLIEKDFQDALRTELGKEKAAILIQTLGSRQFSEALEKHEGFARARDLAALLQNQGVPAAVHIFLTRGFDYYTGVIFEVFDNHPTNNRSLFGGGRYDDLLNIFGIEKVSAVGFGMGDVTIRDVLETYNLLPEQKSKTKLLLIPHSRESIPACKKLATQLRNDGITLAVQLLDKKPSESFKYAEKHHIPFALLIGKDEETAGNFVIKNITTQEQTPLKAREIAAWIKNQA